VQPLGQTVSQTAGRHGDHAVTARGRMPSDGGDDMA
jgi:hypothetical protein